jgi:hypothetical protein
MYKLPGCIRAYLYAYSKILITFHAVKMSPFQWIMGNLDNNVMPSSSWRRATNTHLSKLRLWWDSEIYGIIFWGLKFSLFSHQPSLLVWSSIALMSTALDRLWLEITCFAWILFSFARKCRIFRGRSVYFVFLYVYVMVFKRFYILKRKLDVFDFLAVYFWKSC